MSCNDCGSGGKILKYDSAPGTQGFNGWTPELANVVDSLRVVEQVVDWFGGTGTKPAFGVYVGPIGFVDDISLAVNIRGAQGLVGPVGPAGPVGGIGTGTPGLGVPTGGLKSQVLRKKSNTSFDTEWGNEYKTTSITTIDPSALTLGSTTGFTVLDTMAYTPKETVYAYSIATPATYIMGEVVSYAASILTIKVLQKSGSASANDWQLNLASNELPDYTGVVAKAGLVATNGVLSWEVGESITNNQFYISPGGNDTTGDGSISKPWRTFSRARTQIQVVATTSGQLITLMVIGGSYTNNVNMAIGGSGTSWYRYTINCLPGVSITQTTTSFYNNSLINSFLNIYGNPDLIVADGDTLGGAYLLNIGVQRVTNPSSTISTTFWNFSTINSKSAFCILFGNSLAEQYQALCYFKAANITTATTPTIRAGGLKGVLVFTSASVSNSVTGGVGFELNGFPSVIIENTRFAPTGTFNFTAVRCAVAFSIIATDNNIIEGCVIKNSFLTLRGTTGTFIDISGRGDMSGRILAELCVLTNYNSLAGQFLLGASNLDRISARLCRTSSNVVSSGGAVVSPATPVNVNSVPASVVEPAVTISNGYWFYLPQSV